MDGKLRVNAYLGTGYSYSLRVLPHRWHYWSQKRKGTFKDENLSDRHHLRDRFKFNNPNSTNIICSLMCYVMDWMFMSLQNSYVEILTPNVMVLERGASGRWLGHEGGASMQWDQCPYKGLTRQSSLIPPPVDTAGIRQSITQKRAPLRDTKNVREFVASRLTL